MKGREIGEWIALFGIVALTIFLICQDSHARGGGSFGGSRGGGSSFSSGRSSSFGGSRASGAITTSKSSSFGGARSSSTPAPIIRPNGGSMSGVGRVSGSPGHTTVINNYGGYGYGSRYSAMDYVLFWHLFTPRPQVVVAADASTTQIYREESHFWSWFVLLVLLIFLGLGVYTFMESRR